MVARLRSFPRSVQLLLINQLTINTGFYMLMPYLAAHLSEDLALSTWLIGLILGVRNFFQQGMFLLGGSLADRFGYKPLIVAGCALRTVGFGLLGVADSLWALVVASAATGFAGALFNPAVRAFLAADAGDRRVEAFALFNVFYQAGMLAGPLIGLALAGVSFRVTCGVAASVFAVLTALQLRNLPSRRSGHGYSHDRGRSSGSLWSQWRHVASNRAFLWFAVAMTGSYVLSFQVYLVLPLEARRITGDGLTGTAAVAGLFAVAAAVTIAAQVRVTAWCRANWGPARSLTAGLALMGAAFVPPLAVARHDWTGAPPAAVAVGIGLLATCAGALALATAIVLPFEMDLVVTLARDRLVATHYGLYNTVCGVGIMIGNLATGTVLDGGRSAGLPELPWLVLLVIGVAGAMGIRRLGTLGLLPASVVAADSPGGRHRRRRGQAALWSASSAGGGRHRRGRRSAPELEGPRMSRSAPRGRSGAVTHRARRI